MKTSRGPLNCGRGLTHDTLLSTPSPVPCLSSIGLYIAIFGGRPQAVYASLLYSSGSRFTSPVRARRVLAILWALQPLRPLPGRSTGNPSRPAFMPEILHSRSYSKLATVPAPVILPRPQFFQAGISFFSFNSNYPSRLWRPMEPDDNVVDLNDRDPFNQYTSSI